MSQKNLTYEGKKKELRRLAFSNPEFNKFLDQFEEFEFVHIDHKCALFRTEIYYSYEGRDCYLKYIINPRMGVGENGVLFNLPLQDNYKEIVLRGIKAQHNLKDINGVQFLSQDGFVNNIVGLVGMLELVEGFNLAEVDKIERNLPSLEEKLKVIREFEVVIEGMHNKKFFHSDIKPGNLLVGFNGPIRVIDFSTASSFVDYEKDRRFGLVYGTNGFFDIESMRRLKRDRDYLALGVTLAQVLLGLNRDQLLAHKNERGIRFGYELDDFELIVNEKIYNSFGSNVSEYFRDLMNRSWPYSSSEIFDDEERDIPSGNHTFYFE